MEHIICRIFQTAPHFCFSKFKPFRLEIRQIPANTGKLRMVCLIESETLYISRFHAISHTGRFWLACLSQTDILSKQKWIRYLKTWKDFPQSPTKNQFAKEKSNSIIIYVISQMDYRVFLIKFKLNFGTQNLSHFSYLPGNSPLLFFQSFNPRSFWEILYKQNNIVP